MKKFLIPAMAAMFICLLSCNQPSSTASSAGESDRAKKNLETAKTVSEMFDKNDFSKIGDYIATDAVDHSGMNGEVKGLDSLKKEFEGFASMMKDSKTESVKTVADDDYVFQWNKESWTDAYDDPKMMMKAGEHHTMDAIHVTKHNADGKITDHWGFVSMNDMMKMMGDAMKMMPGGTNMNKMPMDTTKSKMQKK
jgi:hypothetical protein